jgi:hypothetical protein
MLLSLTACATTAPGRTFGGGTPALPSPMSMAAADRPTLYMGPEPDAALIGYVSEDVVLELAGATVGGRVPVRIDGALRARGYVPEDCLVLRVQRRGRVRGTAVYVGPNDRVRVLGREETGNRLRVLVTARDREHELVSQEGTYPAEGLAAKSAPPEAEPPEPGEAFMVPPGTALVLHELPSSGQLAQVAGRAAAYEVRVLNQQDGWFAVRVGSGPYLIGWTNAPLVRAAAAAQAGAASTPATAPTAASSDAATTSPGAATSTSPSLPARLASEAGELRRVVAGAKIVFGPSVIGVLRTDGWARVLKTYPAGYADVFVAADDAVALRGLVRSVDLVEAGSASRERALDVSETSKPAAAR